MQPIIKVNLATNKIESIKIPETWVRDYLGGSSLAARMLYDQITYDLDPLSPEAPLLFMTGPLTGTSGPSVGRFVVCAKSPTTGLWGESNCGGFWGPELRKAGFDGIWIEGKAEKPVYIIVENGEISIRSAEHLWGQDTYEVQDSIKNEIGLNKARVACIGLAGENKIQYAAILCDHGRAAGRTGMGAVMGAKNLKAIAVYGNGKIPVSNNGDYKIIRSQANRDLRNDNFTVAIHELGSAGVADYLDYLGEMPKRGFSRGIMQGADKMSGATMAETILVGVSTCHACVVACGRVVEFDKKRGKQKGPEYETLMGFGSNLWLDDMRLATNLGDICDRYGIDVISVSNTISLAFTLYEAGIITAEDTGGLKLEWGSGSTVEELLHLIVKREGFGAHLAEGAKALGERYGSPESAVQVNGLEVPYHDPRGASGMGLVYATSPRGACHNQSDYFLVEMGQADESLGIEFYSRHGGAEKAANVAKHQDWRTVFNSLVMCYFANVPPRTVVNLINYACGLDWTIEEMMLTGERGWNLKRVINNRLGITRENDKLPKPLLEPLPDGGSEGFVIDFEPMLEAYYQARDWDWKTGFPSKEKLLSLGLDWVAKDLWLEK